MADSVRTPPAANGGWRRRGPGWAGRAACGWAALYGCALSAGALAGSPALLGVPYGAWPAAGLLFAAAACAAATVRPWGRRLPARVVSGGMWTAAALSLAASTFLLLNVIELVVTGTVRDRHGHTDWAGFAVRVSFAVGGVLLVAAALSWRRRTAGACSRCGLVHAGRATAPEHPPPRAASRRVRGIAYAGCAAWIPYFGTHLLHAVGGWFVLGDVSRALNGNGHGPPGLERYLLGCIGLAVFLLLGLVQRWGTVFPHRLPRLAGRRVPRFLPLTPAWVVAPTLMFYPVGGIVFLTAAATGLTGDRQASDLVAIGLAMLGFGGYGWALAVAAVSYQRRTRPVCGGVVRSPVPYALTREERS